MNYINFKRKTKSWNIYKFNHFKKTSKNNSKIIEDTEGHLRYDFFSNVMKRIKYHVYSVKNSVITKYLRTELDVFNFKKKSRSYL